MYHTPTALVQFRTGPEAWHWQNIIKAHSHTDHRAACYKSTRSALFRQSSARCETALDLASAYTTACMLHPLHPHIAPANVSSGLAPPNPGHNPSAYRLNCMLPLPSSPQLKRSVRQIQRITITATLLMFPCLVMLQQGVALLEDVNKPSSVFEQLHFSLNSVKSVLKFAWPSGFMHADDPIFPIRERSLVVDMDRYRAHVQVCDAMLRTMARRLPNNSSSIQV